MGYKAGELVQCVRAIHELQRNTRNCTLPAVREKYRQHKVMVVREALRALGWWMW